MPTRYLVLAAGLALAVQLGCARPPAARPESPPPPVSVAVAEQQTVPVQIRSIGSVKVISTVSVRPRVPGQITEVHFTEGTDVKKGDKLFTIDARPYEAAVKLAEANVAKSTALYKGAELNLRRTTQIGLTAGSQAELDAAKTAVDSARAAVAADEAAANAARLQAEFTTITAPIDGRAGAILATRGNLVASTDLNPLVVINQISPITVSFSVPEQQLPLLAAARLAGPPRVEADLRGGGPLAAGTLQFIDNTVDPGTGTLACKAVFANEDRKLWPGLFVDVTLTLGERPNSVLVPVAAVQAGQQGNYVYVVGAGDVAEARPVAVAFETGGRAVVASGLRPGEVVVTDGQLRVAPGMKVDVRSKPAPGTGTAGGAK
ncbi:rnd transporter : Efflux transporter, RND family, MFP subunit OS=Desulfobacca acetoxidans (strain ATCC 700848 / DSM 11109 / ASRB2) GN=Desac_1403 PE=4 SV=1: HlyD [Gemmataceae bacterium]|nr:rnd transporter : Efflux transporter, RND family, MFP subunit OS=Desulfobacca acetoxidans (strain ATCC 700848 / DSM 11109 / ASRB2) GN=Desac_1403 PE=4 SV=1: HlyD [Gemmataceae bacterium]VTT97365.1 rnd transporter : Efflux transporter, RND family, MFP subunit OS=Desulfobacca acetoxidans (strain ATCC 700848 / DSM 11109 / ASRB2) GN=Desac_1403 PE=4 SV=1: HlyD [Gemmataceae bacterium]